MEKKIITLTTKEQLNIFMNPTRQSLLREIDRIGHPVTPKQLADILKISPSSVQFHIKKLCELGVLELDHTEQIRGITAKFYRAYNADIRIGLEQNNYMEEREALMENTLINVYKGFLQTLHENPEPSDFTTKHGDFMRCIMYLSDEDVAEMYTMMHDFINKHKVRTENTFPWEFALVNYRMEDPK